ncbi:hypothetical protein JIG36_01550 [Actinoplanes sp. LDG1-06]|uniref:Uncharacterized protein n=1 Tax=Paractinoplanes ovalisporus TaxID=2810368 RepID=A0ABS2A3H4_9ACTN|nr:hypothetical protein [Actinoplanes ovalisporus]MBM2614240.1 hypothetical protein [Actinoplanes ovalisporus]
MPELAHQADRIPVSAAQLGAWSGEKLGSTLRLAGPCPACHHDAQAAVALTSTSLEGNTSSPARATLTVAMACNCERAHDGWPGTPPKGCGRTWTASARIAADDQVTLEPADDPYLAEAAAALRTTETGQIDRLRAAAEKWIAGITALFGIVAVLGLTLSADQIRKLAVGGRITVALLLAVAATLAGVAIVRAYQAAYGWPRTRSVADDTELLAWYARHRALPEATATRLRQAVTAAVAALAALVVTGGLTWFLPAAKPDAPLLKVTTRGQEIVCGTLLSSTADSALRVRRADDGTVTTLAVTDIARVTATDKC